ncbi:MAG: hypothetical protein MR411_00290 [Tenericutes bacterium]|nr:hypothetical protein [Mycoplasmatota bacterium]MDD6388292.1 hypothetical protein [Bacilli bacterium]
MRGKEILFRKKELLKRKESLRLRQQIISMVIKKWTENEINDFINSNSNLRIHTEEEIKNHILNNYMYLFNKDELYNLNKIKRK